MSINKLTVLFTFFLIFSKIFCEDSFDFFTFALQWPQEICRQFHSKNETGICNIPGNINNFYLMQNLGMIFLKNFKFLESSGSFVYRQTCQKVHQKGKNMI